MSEVEVVQYYKWTCAHCSMEVKSKKPISFDPCPSCDESQPKTEPKPDPVTVPEHVPAEGPPGPPPPAAPPPGPPAEENKVTDSAGMEAEADKKSKPSPPANSGTPAPNLYPDLSKVEQMEHSSEGGMDRSSSLSPLPQKRPNEESEVEGGQKRRAMSGDVRDPPSPSFVPSGDVVSPPPPPGFDKPQGSRIAARSHIPSGEELEMMRRQAHADGRQEELEKLQHLYQAMKIWEQEKASQPPPKNDEQSDEHFYPAQDHIDQNSPKQRTASGAGSQVLAHSTTQPNPAGGEEKMVSPCYLRKNSTL